MKSSKEKITIVTVNLNNKAGLVRTIESVKNQRNVFCEYIIVDGMSSDGSIDVIQANEGCITKSIIEPDSGVYCAMNKGISAATGEYLLFLNSGDEFYENSSLEKAIPHCRESDLVYCDYIEMRNNEPVAVKIPDAVDFDYFTRNNVNSLPHTSTFIRRELFEEIGMYNESLEIASDWEFFLVAVCKYNCSYTHLSYPLTIFNMHGMSSDPSNSKLIEQERMQILNEHFSTFTSLIDLTREYRGLVYRINRRLLYRIFTRIRSLFFKRKHKK